MAQSFFSPQALANGVNFVSGLAGNGALPLYLLCADGALLRYSFTKNGRQSLSALNAEARTLEPKLLAGTATVADYVRGLATQGELYVRVRSAVWGKEQAVTAPVAAQRRALAGAGQPALSVILRAAVQPCRRRRALGRKTAGQLQGPRIPRRRAGAAKGAGGSSALEPVEDHRAWLADTISQLFWFGHLGFDVTPDHPLFFYTIKALQAFLQSHPFASESAVAGSAFAGQLCRQG